MEAALRRALRWTLAGLAAAPLLLVVPGWRPETLTARTLVHLVVLVGFGLAVTVDLWAFVDGGWFPSFRAVPGRIASGASIVALTTGVVALVTLASSAALRMAPSLQYLQLLSSLDIAWAVAAAATGVRWLAGPRWGVAAGMAVIAGCVASIALYLDAVGFTAQGGWLVDAGALMTYVIPADTVTAVAAVTLLLAGARRVERQRTEQRRPQS